MAYLIPDPPPQGIRLISAYDNSKRPLLDRGLTTSHGPDLRELRRYLAIRQRAEEMSAAEQAMAEGVTGRRRRFLGGKSPEIADPQLRPVTWAVTLRSDRRDLEDARAHHGLDAHAYYVNAPSTEPAVCGFKPKTKRVSGGGRVACLTPACTEANARCQNCLVLLYESALTDGGQPASWPSAEAARATAEVSQASAQVTADAGLAEGSSTEQPANVTGVELDITEGRDETYLAYPPYGQPIEQVDEPLAVAEAAPAYAETELDSQLGQASVDEAQADRSEEIEAEEPGEPETFTSETHGADPVEPIVIPISEDWDAEHQEILAAESEIEVRVEEFSDSALAVTGDQNDALEQVLAEGVSDVIVVVSAGRTGLLVGGIGRGSDWAGTVLDMEHEPLLRLSLGSDQLVNSDEPEPSRICGPYWAKAAVLVPVGESTTVIFGSEAPLELVEGLLIEAANAAAARFQRPDVDSSLADEREVSLAIKRIMDGAELSFEATLEHVLSTTASVLGCSLVAGYARMGRRMAMRAMDLDGTDQLDPRTLLGSSAPVLAGDQRLVVEESLDSDDQQQGVVSRLRLALKGSNVQGLLVLSHTSRRPRGFTTQDQRLAEAIAPAAVLVLERAAFGEGLRALESHLRSAPAADPLTGVANQAAWEEALASEADRLARYGGSAAVAAFKIDGLARIDERQGPQARDAALRQAAELVRGVSRSTDLVARVSDDEFRILVRNAGHQGGRRLATRVRRAARSAQAMDTDLPPLAISWANASSRGQLLQASRQVGQRLRARARIAEHARVGGGRSH